MSLVKKKGYERSNDVFESVVANAPVCKGCNTPMSAFALYHADPTRLRLTKHEAIGVFVCARGPGDEWEEWWRQCSPGNPQSVDGRRAVLYKIAPKLTRPGKRGFYARVADVDPNMREQLDDEDEDERPMPGFYERLGCKLGGSARNIGGGDPCRAPACPKCGQTMEFVAQVGSTKGLKFDSGDGFVGHVYLCPSEHSAKLQIIYA